MAPEFVTSNETSVMENVPINTVVMAIKAIDKDEGRNSYIEYSLSPVVDGCFSLGPVDGLLRVSASIVKTDPITHCTSPPMTEVCHRDPRYVLLLKLNP